MDSPDQQDTSKETSEGATKTKFGLGVSESAETSATTNNVSRPEETGHSDAEHDSDGGEDVVLEDAVDNEDLPQVLGKRKRDQDNRYVTEKSLFIPDENDMVPDEVALSEDDDDDSTDVLDSLLDEETDDDNLDDIGGGRIPYDPHAEPLPDCAIYDDGIGGITSNLIRIPQYISQLLLEQECDTGHVKMQKEAAANLLKIPAPPKFRIALLGDAGAGKSSILNSITDIADLAKSLSGGQSCTCVPTEYTGALPRQRKDYAAKIFYYNMGEIRDILKELLRDYNDFTFELDENWDEETLTAFKRKMQNALKVFTTLFCDRDEFRTTQAARQTLESAYNDSGQVQLLATMLEDCEEKLKDKLGPSGYSEYCEANSRAKLREVVDPLVASTGSGQVALWPLVKLVYFGIRGSRVLRHITICDLPGVSDTNDARVNLTKQHVKTCDYIWIVANISRVIDDGMVHFLLSRYAKIFKGNVAIICTHSDDGVDSKLVQHLRDHHQDVSDYVRLSAELKAKKSAITQLKATITKRKGRKSNTKAKLLEIQAQEDEFKAMQAEWTAIDASRFGALVLARNAYVIAQVREQMTFHFPTGSQLNVFCISNPHYAAAKGLANIRGSKLDGVVTGIPALRGFALTLPAPKLLQTLDDYAKGSVGMLLKSLALWVNQTPVERRKDLMEIPKQPLQALSSRISDRQKKYLLAVEEDLSKPMRKKVEAIAAAAAKVHHQKSEKHHSTIRAYIRKNGLHSTKLCPKECWNEQFSKAAIDITTAAFAELEDALGKYEEELETECVEDIRKVMENLRAHPFAVLLPIDRLSELNAAHIDSIGRAFRRRQEKCEKELRNNLLDVTQHSDKNHFSKLIQPVYDECKADHGTGVTRRSMDKLKDFLEQPKKKSPFTLMEKEVTKALQKTDAKHLAVSAENIKTIFEHIVESFDGAIDRRIDDPSEKAVRDQLKAELVGINRDYEASCAKFEAVKARYDA